MLQSLGPWKSRKYSSNFENKTAWHRGVKENSI